MKIVLDLALSADGFIAKTDGDSGWVSERTEDLFKQRIQEAGSLVVGNTTFEQYRGVIYPVKGALNIVLSRDAQESDNSADVVYASSPQEAVQIATDNNCPGVLIAGGAAVSQAFLEQGLIDEIYFSVHSIRLGEGMRPFGEVEIPLNLILLDSKDVGDGIRQDHYRVGR